MNKRKQLGSLFAPNGYKAGYGLLSSPWGEEGGGWRVWRAVSGKKCLLNPVEVKRSPI